MLAKCAFAALLATVSAQCTLPADLPADTAFAAGNPAECVLGARALPSAPCSHRPHPRAGKLFPLSRAELTRAALPMSLRR